ncbi:hypothetical protein AB0758_48945 [Tolypothrix bouteillei VB521301_2]|uniref:Uncharacterized protein n=1 Tax=Tolypothrix bouteillei VB521301 TaxID=1479485 RepID=A0A0C1NGN3_9CYAN
MTNECDSELPADRDRNNQVIDFAIPRAEATMEPMAVENSEVYNHLADRETLVIYMTKTEGESVSISGDLLTNGRITRILQESYDFRPIHKRRVEIGERLRVSASIPGKLAARTIPTDWVVTSTETYEPKDNIPGFREVVVAYCEQIPLSLEEFRKAVYDSGVTVSLDSFGGDEQAYQQFKEQERTKVNSHS